MIVHRYFQRSYEIEINNFAIYCKELIKYSKYTEIYQNKQDLRCMNIRNKLNIHSTQIENP